MQFAVISHALLQDTSHRGCSTGQHPWPVTTSCYTGFLPVACGGESLVHFRPFCTMASKACKSGERSHASSQTSQRLQVNVRHPGLNSSVRFPCSMSACALPSLACYCYSKPVPYLCSMHQAVCVFASTEQSQHRLRLSSFSLHHQRSAEKLIMHQHMRCSQVLLTSLPSC